MFLTTFLREFFVSEDGYVTSGCLNFFDRRSAHPVGSSIMLLAGFGFLSRMHGLSVDNLVEVEMVLADGRIVIINKEDEPGRSRALVLFSIHSYSCLASSITNPGYRSSFLH